MKKIPKKKAGQSGDDGNSSLRNQRIWISVSPEEHGKISGYYENSPQKTFANFCRTKLLEKPGAVQDKNKIVSEIVTSMYQQNKIGNNLNQIAKKVNTIKSDYPELLTDLKNELDELKRLKKNLILKLRKG